MELAIRIDCSEKQKNEIATSIDKYLSASKYLWVFEISKKVKKPHIHGYCQLNEKVKLDTVSKWMRRQKWYNGKGSVSCVEVKDLTKYKDYIMKDMSYFRTNLAEEEIDYLIEKAQEIKTDKQLKLVDKLYNWVIGSFIDDELPKYTNGEILRKIIAYYKHKNEKGEYIIMPNRQQMFQYVSTIQVKLNNDNELDILYKNLF